METREPIQAGSIEYERPRIVDYGTLVEMTKGGSATNEDVMGNVNSAIPNPS